MKSCVHMHAGEPNREPLNYKTGNLRIT